MRQVCECNSASCALMVEVSVHVIAGYRQKADFTAIVVEGCKTKPEPTDKLIARENGYLVYQVEE